MGALKEQSINAEEYQPCPISLMPEQVQPLPYPVEHLGVLSPAVKYVADVLQVPQAIAAGCALGIMSTCVQGIADVETLEGSKRPLSLFLITVAKSGDRKTSCDAIFSRPIQEFERQRRLQYDQDKQVYEVKELAWKTQRAKLTKPSATEDYKDMEKALLDLGKMPHPPLLPELIVSDTTSEGLVKKFALSYPSLAILNDEGGVLLGGYSMTPENRLRTLATYSKLWDGNPINRTRAGENESMLISGKRLSVHIMAQKMVADQLLQDQLSEDQGFLARCLISFPESLIGTRLELKSVDENHPALQDFFTKAKTCLNMTSALLKGTVNELDLPVIRLSNQAHYFLSNFYRETELAQGSGGKYETIQPYASKACEMVCRIAGQMILFTNPDTRKIDGSTMSDAIELMRYYLAERVRVREESFIPDDMMRAEKLRGWLQILYQKGTEYIALQHVYQNSPRPYKLRTKEASLKAIQKLEEYGWLIPSDKPSCTIGNTTYTNNIWRIVLAPKN